MESLHWRRFLMNGVWASVKASEGSASGELHSINRRIHPRAATQIVIEKGAHYFWLTLIRLSILEHQRMDENELGTFCSPFTLWRHCTSDGEPNEDGKDTLGYSWILSDSSRTNKLGKLLLISAHLENKKSDRDSQFNRGRTGGQRGPNEGPMRGHSGRTHQDVRIVTDWQIQATSNSGNPTDWQPVELFAGICNKIYLSLNI